MKKLLLVVVFMSNLFANSYEVKLYEKIIPSVFQKGIVVVYASKDTKEFFKNRYLFSITDDCTKADIIVGKKFEQLNSECLKKPFFTTSYRAYRKYSNSIGAFYWKKGRPQLQFDLQKIEKYHLFLPKSLRRYSK